MAEPGSILLGFVLTLMLHASVLLGAVWLLERVGMLRQAAHAELAWRTALFGALLTVSLSFAGSVFDGSMRSSTRSNARLVASSPASLAPAKAAAPQRAPPGLPGAHGAPCPRWFG